MSKLKHLMVAIVASTVLTAGPAFAISSCKDGKFAGSYTRAALLTDIWGDNSGVDHTFVTQLTLTGDGTVFEHFTGDPDIFLSAGTFTPAVGSWKCRSDGMLVVTTIQALYLPTYDASSHGVLNTPVDLLLYANFRTTRLFTVTDANTLTRVQFRRRQYAPVDDPTDPTGGTLGPLLTGVGEFKRLVASDADLLAP